MSLGGIEFEIIFFIISTAVIILVIRLLGAWMLRINDVIKYQKEILEELRKQNGKVK